MVSILGQCAKNVDWPMDVAINTLTDLVWLQFACIVQNTCARALRFALPLYAVNGSFKSANLSASPRMPYPKNSHSEARTDRDLCLGCGANDYGLRMKSVPHWDLLNVYLNQRFGWSLLLSLWPYTAYSFFASRFFASQLGKQYCIDVVSDIGYVWITPEYQNNLQRPTLVNLRNVI